MRTRQFCILHFFMRLQHSGRVRVPADKLLAVVVTLQSLGCSEVIQSMPEPRYRPRMVRGMMMFGGIVSHCDRPRCMNLIHCCGCSDSLEPMAADVPHTLN